MTQTCYTRRVGSNLEVSVKLLIGDAGDGAPPAAGIQINAVPAAYTVDETKFAGFGGIPVHGRAYDASTGGFYIAASYYSAPTDVIVFFSSTTATSQWSNTVPMTWANTDQFGAFWSVPIQ